MICKPISYEIFVLLFVLSTTSAICMSACMQCFPVCTPCMRVFKSSCAFPIIFLKLYLSGSLIAPHDYCYSILICLMPTSTPIVGECMLYVVSRLNFTKVVGYVRIDIVIAYFLFLLIVFFCVFLWQIVSTVRFIFLYQVIPTSECQPIHLNRFWGNLGSSVLALEIIIALLFLFVTGKVCQLYLSQDWS